MTNLHALKKSPTNQDQTGRGLLVAAPGTGSGKTSLACGILAALRRRGLEVRAAKCGPDYLDPLWLGRASGKACPNLDAWMAGEEGVRSLAAGEGFLLVEGAMGLYDGIRPESDEGSGAEIARILGIPILLVVDASGAARTVAAVVKGLRDFGPIGIAGVVANRTGSDGHARLVARALESAGLPPLVGHVRAGAIPPMPERHLGLLPPAGDDAIFGRLADAVEESVDLDGILRAAGTLAPQRILPPVRKTGAGLRLGLAWDEAFRFAYDPVVRALEERGVDVVRFSPIADRSLPPSLDGLWLCGGYPEAHARELSENVEMREAVADFCGTGRPVLAECGGLLYLAQELTDPDGSTFPLCGVVPARGRVGRRLRAIGYRSARPRVDVFLAKTDSVLRGHEFHHGDLEGDPEGTWSVAFELEDSDGKMHAEGWWNGSVLATWFHGWLHRPDVLKRWISALRGASEGGRE